MKLKSSIFFISSPLQAICVEEACHHYDIDKYIIYVLDDGRLDQVIKYLKEKKMNYVVYDKKNIFFLDLIKGLICYLLPIKKDYDSLFIGNVYMLKYILLFLPFLRRGSCIVQLDDGNIILKYVNENKRLSRSRELLKKTISILTVIKNIKSNILFSVFADELSNSKYLIEKNSLNLLKSKIHGNNNNVFIIGTFIDEFCHDFGITRNFFLIKFKLLISELQNRYPGKKIIYIPHGRESNNEDIVLLCKKLHVDFLKLNECVEIYFSQLESKPIAILGFASSALFTLHIIFQCVPIININLKNSEIVNDEYRVINEVYNRAKIQLLEI